MLQNHLAVDREIVGGGKQSRVSGDAIHAIRSRIVNLATQPNLTFRANVCGRVAEIIQLRATLFSRRDSGFQRCTRTKAGVRHSQWSKNILLRKLFERYATGASHNLAQRDETEIAVSETCARRIAQRLFDQSPDRFAVAGPTLAQIEVGCVTTDMRQQLLDRDALSSLAFQFRNVD